MRTTFRGSGIFDFNIYKVNGEFREPKKGEFYIHNGLAYRAKYDMGSMHFICKPIH